MIPKEVIAITETPYFGYLGTRNEALTPTLLMLWGLDFKAADNIATAFVVETQCQKTLANLQDNGRAGLTFSDSLSHVAYQLKGRFLQARPLHSAELTLQQQYRSVIIETMTQMGYQEELVKTVICVADLAIDCQIETIFNQTPGPAAGKEIAF